MEIVNLPLTLLKNSKYNPPTRTDKEKLESLIESVREIGVQIPIPVHPDEEEPGKYIISDGHGRVKASEILGFSTIPCIIKTKETRDQIFALNITHKKHTSGEQLAAIIRGGPIESCSGAVKNAYNLIKKIYSPEEQLQFATGYASSQIFTNCSAIVRLAKGHDHKFSHSSSFLKELINFCMENKEATGYLSTALKDFRFNRIRGDILIARVRKALKGKNPELIRGKLKK